MEATDTLLILPEVARLTRLSKPSLYRMMSKGTFPRPLRIGENRIAWQKSVVLEWIHTRPAA